MSGIFLVAGEASGDALGADLIRVLKARDPSLVLRGVGGLAMAGEGVESEADTSGLAVLGFVEGLMAYDRVKRAVAATVQAALEAKPNVVVLIDSWGFTLRVAQGIRAVNPSIRLVKYVGPQVWATRPGRAKTLAAAVDHLICIHDFEVPFYAPYNLPITVSGHPAVGRYKPGDANAFRARHHFAPTERMLLVLPGSRPSEIKHLAETFWRAAETLQQTRPDIRLATVVAHAVREQVIAQTPANALILEEQEKEDAFAAAHAVVAASGTVTTEVALQGAPVVVGYKLGWITWAIARAILLKSKYTTLMNVAADSEVAPEIIQTRFNAANLIAATAPLLDDPAFRQKQIDGQDGALRAMGRGARPAAEIAADAVLGELAKS